MEKPQLQRATFHFVQQGNGNGTTQEIEELTIECDSPIGIDDDKGCFYVFKTEGWSIDNLSEIQELLDRIDNVIKVKDKK